MATPEQYQSQTRDLTKKPARKNKRAYESAKVNRLYSLSTTPKPMDVDVINGLRALVSRSRHEAQNNDYMRQFLRECKSNIIGSQGIILQARCKNNKGDLDKQANDAIEESWKDWSKYGTPEVTGTMSLKILERLFVETLFRDGEVLMLEHMGTRHNKYRYSLEMLDSQVLDSQYNHDLRNGNVIRMGVELNVNRKPVAYHLLTSAKTANDYYNFRGKKYIRVDASRVIHRFLPEWAWQTRGVPAAAASLMRMNMLSGYEDAELVAARIAATKMGFYTSPDGEPPPSAGFQETESEDGAERIGDFTQEAEPGHFDVLPEGYSLQTWEPQHPNQAFKDFMKAMLRGIASGLGVNYNSLANDLEGVNYNSLRHGSIVERAMWMLLQDWMIESFMDVIYQHWLGMALLAGEIKVGDRPLRADRFDKYTRVNFQPRRWPWVDPAKEMKANVDAINTRIRSISSIIRERGDDPDDVFEEIAKEREKLNELNIPINEAVESAFLQSGGQENESDT